MSTHTSTGATKHVGLGPLIARAWPFPLSQAFARDSSGTVDLFVFSILLVLTAAFGRPFSKLGASGTHVFVTELGLALTLVLAVRRCGIRGVVERVRERLPIVPLLAFWVAGAIALIRGLHSYGVSGVIHDVGLAEYSVVLAIVAITADTRRKVAVLFNVLIVAGVASASVFVVVYFVSPHGALGLDVNPSSGVGLYIAGFVVLFGARGIHGARWTRVEIGAGAFAVTALVLLSLMVARSVLVALVTTALILAVLAPRRRGLVAAVAIATIGISIALAVGLEHLRIGGVTTVAAAAPIYVRASPNFIADDGLSAFNGGTVVRGDAVSGHLSREITSHGVPYFELAALHGLHRGWKYTISFWLKPLGPVRTSGRVGDTSGYHWGQQVWFVKGRRRWQRVRKTFVATKATERLVVYVDSGAPRVLIDGMRVTRPGDSAINAPPTPIRRLGPRQRTQPALIATIGDSFSNSDNGSGAYINQSWRLAFWGYMLRQTVHDPVFGVGFGKPAAFRWHGTLFDARRGDPADPNDVTGPHNSFVDLLYRTGLMGALSFLAIVVIAFRRVWMRLRRPIDPEERSRLVGIVALFAFAVVIASLNVALEGPYMSIFFWTILALLLLLPLQDRDADTRQRA